MLYSGSPKAYLALLRIFYGSLDRNADEIGMFYRAGDWKNYTIRMHSLKSSARLIGAESFGEEAQLLENAGRSGDAEYIRANHGDFMEEYQSFKAPLSEIFAKEQMQGEMPEADPEMLHGVYGKIRAAAEDMDIEALESILSEMKKYRIPENERALWKELTDAVSRYDYDKITELL